MNSRPGRTFELKLLITLFLLLALASALRLSLALQVGTLLAELGASASPLYLALSAGVWGMLGLACACGLVFRQRWAPLAARICAVLVALWYWIDRIVLDQTAVAQQNWLFSAIATLVCLVFTFAVLALPAQKEFFRS
jgi:hypothetical protein